MGMLVKWANKIENNSQKLVAGANDLMEKAKENLDKSEKMTKLEKTIASAQALDIVRAWNKERIEKGEQPYIPNTLNREEKRMMRKAIDKMIAEKTKEELAAFEASLKQ